MKTLKYFKNLSYFTIEWDTEDNKDFDNYIKTRYPDRMIPGIRTPIPSDPFKRRLFRICELDTLIEEVGILGYELVDISIEGLS